jgi:hypothetical protein
MSLVLVTPLPLLEIVWISLNDFDTCYYLGDITLDFVRIRITENQQPNFPTGIVIFSCEFCLGPVES